MTGWKLSNYVQDLVPYTLENDAELDKAMEFIHRMHQVKWDNTEAKVTGKYDEVEPHTHTLMFHMGKTIYFSKGSQANIKITTKEDLDLFEGYLLMKERRNENKD